MKRIGFYNMLHNVPQVLSVKLGGVICQNTDSKLPYIYLELGNISVYMQFKVRCIVLKALKTLEITSK